MIVDVHVAGLARIVLHRLEGLGVAGLAVGAEDLAADRHGGLTARELRDRVQRYERRVGDRLVDRCEQMRHAQGQRVGRQRTRGEDERILDVGRDVHRAQERNRGNEAAPARARDEDCPDAGKCVAASNGYSFCK